LLLTLSVTGSTDVAAPIQSMNDAINKVAQQMPTNLTEAMNQVKNTTTNTLANAGLAAKTNGVRNVAAPGVKCCQTVWQYSLFANLNR
jgi:hypothetical protein